MTAPAIHLRLLGVPSLEGPGEDPAGVLSQPKRLALLAYLAVQGGFVRRDVLAEIFWSGWDADRARRALSQATHTLRRSLGRSAIRSRGTEELGISPDHVWIDVRAFEAAVAGGRLEEAVELHRGELLRGLNGDQVTAEFSRWLDGERLRLQRAAAGAAKRLAESAFRSGDVAGAISWQRKAVQVRPLDEAMFRDYLALLDESGDAAQALREYDSFRSRLADEYDLEPARETVRLIEMIRGQRPESIGAVSSRDSAVAVPESALQVAIQARSNRRRRWLRAAVGLLGLVAIIAVIAWPTGSGPVPAPAIVGNRIAVMYLEPRYDSAAVPIADGITNGLINHLGGYSQLEVVPENAVSPYRGKVVDRDSLVSRLNAALYLTGNVRQVHDSTAVLVELTRADGTIVFRGSRFFPGGNVITITEDVIRLVMDSLPRIGAELERRAIQYGTDDSIAAEWVLRARDLGSRAVEHMAPEDFSQVPGFLAQADSFATLAVDRDRDWADAYYYRARLAATRITLCYAPVVDCDWESAFGPGIEDASRVIELEPDNARGYALRASLRWQSFLHGVVTDTTILDAIEADANAAILRSDRQPQARFVLSQVHLEHGEWEKARRAALLASEEDEFADDRSQYLAVLFVSSFNLYRDSVATEYCDSLESTSAALRYAACALQLLAWSPRLQGDTAEARRVADAFLRTMPHQSDPQTELRRLSVVARAVQQDSVLADSVLALVRDLIDNSPDIDELYLLAAEVAARLRRDAAAASYLTAYISPGPAKRQFVIRWRAFAEVNLTLPIIDPEESRPGR